MNTAVRTKQGTAASKVHKCPDNGARPTAIDALVLFLVVHLGSSSDTDSVTGPATKTKYTIATTGVAQKKQQQ